MGEADGGSICNLTVQYGLYYLHIFINGFDLCILIDSGAMHIFCKILSGLILYRRGMEYGTVGSDVSDKKQNHYK